MESTWFIACLVLIALAIVQALLVTLQTWEHRRYARSCMKTMGKHDPRGHVALFAPCKGVDLDLEENLGALMRQGYDDYEVVFVVESEEDPACAVIRRVMAEHRRVAARLVVAGRASRSGQKVHNLQVATADLAPEVEYLAFVDSDARPRPEWLRALIWRLDRPEFGAATGYRWFVPARDSMANHLLYSMNCGVMSLLGRSSHYLIWGGSWAIRRELFESLGMRRQWEGMLSDDLTASRVLRRAGLEVRFEPACVVASPLDCSMAEMFEFTRRQYVMGRYNVPGWWALGLASSTLSTVAWLGSLAALGWGLVSGSPLVWIPAGTCAVLYGLGVYRGLLRQDLIRTYFPQRQQALRKARRFDVWMGPVAGLANWLAVLGSLFGRHVTWRGIRYRLSAGGQAVTVSRDDEPTLPFVPQDEDPRAAAAGAEEPSRSRKIG